MAVVSTDVVRRVSLNGSVAPSERSTVYAPMTIKVLDVRVRMGQHVQSGQVLASLDPSTVDTDLLRRQIAVARAEAALSKARAPESTGAGATRAASDNTASDLELEIKRLELKYVVHAC